MFKILLKVFFLGVFITGCTSFSGKEFVERKTVVINHIDFDSDTQIVGIAPNECNVIEKINNAIDVYGHEFDLDALRSKSREIDSDVLVKTKIIGVFANNMELLTGAAYSPFGGWMPTGSSDSTGMVISVEIIKNGVTIKRQDKMMNTKKYFSACSRIEHVANAMGVYVLKFTSKVLKKHQ